MIPVSFEQAFLRQSPVPLAVAIARDEAGRYNPITIAWFTRIAQEPPMLAIAVGRDKYSSSCIAKSGMFTLSIPAESQKEMVMFFGTVSGRDADKLAQSGAATLPATAIDGVMLAGAVASYECVVKEAIAVGDHTLFIAEVIASHENEDKSLRPLFLSSQL